MSCYQLVFIMKNKTICSETKPFIIVQKIDFRQEDEKWDAKMFAIFKLLPGKVGISKIWPKSPLLIWGIFIILTATCDGTLETTVSVSCVVITLANVTRRVWAWVWSLTTNVRTFLYFGQTSLHFHYSSLHCRRHPLVLPVSMAFALGC